MERLRGNGATNPRSQNDIFQVSPEIVDLYRAYSASKNPSSLIDQMTEKIPVIGQIRSGGNMKERFYNLCKQKGVDPETILTQLRR
jgi:hypothetical protein